MDKEIRIDILALATCGRNREQRQIVSATHGHKKDKCIRVPSLVGGELLDFV